MNIIRQEAKNLIDKLPDNATWDDIMYELYVNKEDRRRVEGCRRRRGRIS